MTPNEIVTMLAGLTLPSERRSKDTHFLESDSQALARLIEEARAVDFSTDDVRLTIEDRALIHIALNATILDIARARGEWTRNANHPGMSATPLSDLLNSKDKMVLALSRVAAKFNR